MTRLFDSFWQGRSALSVMESSSATEGAVTSQQRADVRFVAGSTSQLSEEKHRFRRERLFGLPCGTEVKRTEDFTSNCPLIEQPWGKKARRRRRLREPRRQLPKWRKRFQKGPNEKR